MNLGSFAQEIELELTMTTDNYYTCYQFALQMGKEGKNEKRTNRKCPSPAKQHQIARILPLSVFTACLLMRNKEK